MLQRQAWAVMVGTAAARSLEPPAGLLEAVSETPEAAARAKARAAVAAETARVKRKLGRGK